MSHRPILLVALAAAIVGLLALVSTWGGDEPAEDFPLGSPATRRAIAAETERATLAPSDALGVVAGAARRTEAAAAEPDEVGVEGVPAEPWRIRVTTQVYEGRGRPGVPRGDLGVRIGTRFPDPAAAVLAEGRTGADGTWDLELSPEVVAALDGARPVAWVLEDGWQFRPRSFQLPDEPPADPLEVRLVAEEGRALVGRLFDPEDSPTRGRVQLYEPGADRTLRSRGNTTADDDGWFALDYSREGRFHVGAESELGTAVLRDLALDLRKTPDPVELRLLGPGRLRGVVRDGTGDPAPGLSLLLREAALDRDSGAGWNLPEPRASDLRLEGRGRLQTYETTDERGEFDVSGLLAGAWVIRTRGGSSRAYDVELTSGPVPANGEPLVLSLRRPHLRVRLLGREPDPEAEPPREEAAASEGSSFRASFSSRRVTWPPETRLVVHALEAGARLDSTPTSLPARLVGEDEYVVEVEEEKTYVVGAYGGAHPWAEPVVHVPPSAGRIEVELRLPAARPPGAVLLSVVDSAGEPRTDRMSVTLHDAAAGAAVVRYSDLRGLDWPLRLEVPAGRYRLVVRDEGSGRGWDSGSSRTAGRFETLVEVPPDGEQPVLATLPEGARIRLRLTGEATSADEAAARERLGERGAQWAATLARSVRVSLLDDDGQVAQSVAFERPGGRTDSRVPFDYEGTSGVVFAGRFVLEARTEGGRVASTPVLLVDGETTEVALSFDE